MQTIPAAVVTETPLDMLRRHALYAAVSENDLQALLEAGKVRSFHRGEVLHSPYDICREFTLVVSGSVQVVRYVPGERELIMRHVNAGETYGEILEDRLMLYLSKAADRRNRNRNQRAAESDSQMDHAKYRDQLYEEGEWFRLPMTKTDLAKQLGCSREALSRVFHSLIKKRFIEMNGRNFRFIS